MLKGARVCILRSKSHCEGSGVLSKEYSCFRVSVLRCSFCCVIQLLWTHNTRLRCILILKYLCEIDGMSKIYEF